MTKIEILILGSGTSQGIPAIGCSCATCRSSDPRDARLRPSALFRIGDTRLLIDTSSDFRQQMLAHHITRIDAVLMTHAHFDHIGGFDDLRQFNFLQRRAMDVFGSEQTLAQIRSTFNYAFGETLQKGGGVPQALLYELLPNVPHTIHGVEVLPLHVMHGRLPVLGYRIGSAAYITDTNFIPAETLDLLRGLDVLVLDALRHTPHATHFSLDESMRIASRIGARKTYFTHIAHDIMHERDSRLLLDNMEFCSDGLVVTAWTHKP